MKLKIKGIKLIVCLIMLVFFFGTTLFAQEAEMLKVAVSGISKPLFNPERDTQVTIKGEILYLTKAGTFEEPVVSAKIDGVNADLRVNLSPLSLDTLPEEYKDLAKRWSLTVQWNGKEDSENFIVKPGRYTCSIEAKVLKKEVIVETDENGQEIEKIIETESVASASAPILIVEN